MKIYRIIEKICLSLMHCFWNLFVKIHEKKNIKKKKNIYKKVKLTKNQKKQIDGFYKENYGKKISYKWHRLYTAYTGNFDYRYFPEYLFSTKLDNNRNKVIEFENKALLNTLFENVSEFISVPKIYLKKINGIFFDENDNQICLNDAVKIINKKYKKFVIKKSIDSNSGRGVRLISLKEDNINIKELLEEFDDNYIVEEIVNQSPIVNKIYDKSINTLRVITYRTNSGFFVAPIVMRIGRGGNVVDNAHAGGIFISVNNDGSLGKNAFTEYNQKFSKHPETEVVFYNYKLPNIDTLRKEVIKLHKRLPNLRFISWDFAINNNNAFTLIEVNLHSQAVWITQMAHGKGFFENNTEEILKELRG